MNVSRARACVAEGSVRTCLALSAVCARLASGAPRVKKTWMNVPRSHRPADLAAVTTQWAPSTVPALLASAPEGLGRPAKMWMSVPVAHRPAPMAGVRTWKVASSASAPQASSPMLPAPSARMWTSVRTTWHVLGRSV